MKKLTDDADIRDYVKRVIRTGSAEQIKKVMARYRLHMKERGLKLNEVHLKTEPRYANKEEAKKIFFDEEVSL